MNTPTPPMPDAVSTQSKKRGCLFYGCLISLILAVIIGVGFGVGVWYVAKTVRGVLEQYTDTAPAALAKANMPDADYRDLEKRVAAFGEALQAGRVPEALSLGAGEINALFDRHESMTMWKDRVEVMMDGGELRAKVSMPLDQLGEVPLMKSLQGRYLNGEAALEVGMMGGQLQVRFSELQVKGQQVPAQVMEALRQQNLADAVNQNPKMSAFLQKLGGVSVKDGALVVEPKGKQE